MLPKTNAYVKAYERQTKSMNFLIEDDNLLEKCNTVWDIQSALKLKRIWIASLSSLAFEN